MGQGDQWQVRGKPFKGGRCDGQGQNDSLSKEVPLEWRMLQVAGRSEPGPLRYVQSFRHRSQMVRVRVRGFWLQQGLVQAQGCIDRRDDKESGSGRERND